MIRARERELLRLFHNSRVRRNLPRFRVAFTEREGERAHALTERERDTFTERDIHSQREKDSLTERERFIHRERE